jgi:hypothetical protein
MTTFYSSVVGNSRDLGSTRLWRVGFGVSPKQTSTARRFTAPSEIQNKVRDREDALADTRDACATQTKS